VSRLGEYPFSLRCEQLRAQVSDEANGVIGTPIGDRIPRPRAIQRIQRRGEEDIKWCKEEADKNIAEISPNLSSSPCFAATLPT
jgi:hypothetical protein